MPVEYKASKAFTMGIDDRTVTGIFAVYGNVDDGDGWTTSGDRCHPGMFGDFTVNGRARAKFLWQHRMGDPPIATIDRLFEVPKADLPAPVRLYAPDATGGCAVTRTYLETSRGNEVLAGLKAGAITEMSFAYDPKEWSYEEVDGRDLPIRNLIRADLIDCSDVNLGMNPATSADGSKTLSSEHDAVLAAVHAYIDRYKALAALRAKDGRVLSGENRKRIETAVAALDEAKATLADLLAATEPKQQPPPPSRRASQDLYREWQRVRQQAAQLGALTT